MRFVYRTPQTPAMRPAEYRDSMLTCPPNRGGERLSQNGVTQGRTAPTAGFSWESRGRPLGCWKTCGSSKQPVGGTLRSDCAHIPESVSPEQPTRSHPPSHAALYGRASPAGAPDLDRAVAIGQSNAKNGSPRSHGSIPRCSGGVSVKIGTSGQ